MLRILDNNGCIADDAQEPSIPESDLVKMYRFMLLSRIADDKAFSLQREGRIRTYAQLRGQEAAQIGSAMALAVEDWIFPGYRDLGAMVVGGVPLQNIYLYWMGNEEGSRMPEGVNVFPVSIPVGSQIAIGAGFANAVRLKGENGVTLIYFGDGATSGCDFHEGMNLAGVYNIPAVFFCENNQWAISMPRSKQTASRTIAQKAEAYGFNGIQVDGNDILAVYTATRKAVGNAREGGGPTLIEAYTYRMCDHTTADDATRYRTQSDVDEWAERDPVKRFRLYLEAKGLLDDALAGKAGDDAAQMVDNAVKEAESVPPPLPADIFRYTYAEMPQRLREELRELEDSL